MCCTVIVAVHRLGEGEFYCETWRVRRSRRQVRRGFALSIRLIISYSPRLTAYSVCTVRLYEMLHIIESPAERLVRTETTRTHRRINIHRNRQTIWFNTAPSRLQVTAECVSYYYYTRKGQQAHDVKTDKLVGSGIISGTICRPDDNT